MQNHLRKSTSQWLTHGRRRGNTLTLIAGSNTIKKKKEEGRHLAVVVARQVEHLSLLALELQLVAIKVPDLQQQQQQQRIRRAGQQRLAGCGC